MMVLFILHEVIIFVHFLVQQSSEVDVNVFGRTFFGPHDFGSNSLGQLLAPTTDVRTAEWLC